MDANICDALSDLDPEIKQRLELTDIYQQFLLKRAELDKLAHDEYARSGGLTSNKINALKKDVEALGTQVLHEIRRIRFMLNEPSFEDFQAIRNRMKAK